MEFWKRGIYFVKPNLGKNLSEMILEYTILAGHSQLVSLCWVHRIQVEKIYK